MAAVSAEGEDFLHMVEVMSVDAMVSPVVHLQDAIGMHQLNPNLQRANMCIHPFNSIIADHLVSFEKSSY